MAKLRCCRSTVLKRLACAVIPYLALGCSAYGQVHYPEQEVRIQDLPSLTVRSRDASEVLAASVEITLRNKEVCCGKESSLGDRVRSGEARSLKEVARRLQGRQLLTDGRPINIGAEYFAPDEINSGYLVNMLTAKRAPLLEWNSHVYVVSGVVFEEYVDSSGAMMYSIHRFLLLDTRFSGARRQVGFNRESDDWGKVQGMLLLTVAPQ
jgi:hypothetical protein